MEVKQIARVCHEANRAYCATLGDSSQAPWDVAPEWQRKSAMTGVEFHLKTLESGAEPQPSASHESWLKEKEADGWKFGPVKNADTKEHPCFVPYEQLPAEQKLKDYIFCGIVKAFYEAAHTAMP
jgi:RyR domain